VEGKHYCPTIGRQIASWLLLNESGILNTRFGSTPQSKGNLRRHERVLLDSPVQVLWRDRSGVDNTVHGRVIDVSELGIRIKVPAAIDKGVYVTMHAAKVPLQGTAAVKSCKQQGLGYVIGLEFTRGLRWKPKPAGVESPNK